ncbi:MAG TPA: GNAT family N-acetyltransferase, partial [Mycobacteriales bacterium]|nr:GNAT family N-acetyltransferase [Mycobacteriales bacterium]
MTQPPDVQIRPLEPDELVEAWRLGRLAFGGPATQPPDLTADHRPATRWGAFAAGRLLAKATDLHHEQYWGAQVVPACGVAGVAVLPEHRRQGLTRRVLTALLHGADERGAAVSNLFCTSAAVYRALGWEVTGFLREVELPTAALNRPSADAVRARSGSGRDL